MEGKHFLEFLPSPYFYCSLPLPMQPGQTLGRQEGNGVISMSPVTSMGTGVLQHMTTRVKTGKFLYWEERASKTVAGKDMWEWGLKWRAPQGSNSL